MRYKFYCRVCKKEVTRKEVMPLLYKFENTAKGYPRQTIVRAMHYPGCMGQGDLRIKVFEKNSKEIQEKLEYDYDQNKSRS